jgi:hypothetical protein
MCLWGGCGGCVHTLSTHLFLDDHRLCVNVPHDLAHVGLENHPSHANLVDNVVHFLDVKDEVELTDVLKPEVRFRTRLPVRLVAGCGGQAPAIVR